MGPDQSGVLTVGSLVPDREDTPCLITPCLSFPPGVVSHIGAVPMQHMVNKAYTRWVAANLINGQLVHAGNHRQGTGGADRVSALFRKQWSVKNQWPSAREWLSRGANGPLLRCNAEQL